MDLAALLESLRAKLPATIRDRLLYVTLHGSHAYGTSQPSSDLDVRGVAMPPRECLLGYRKGFEQAELKEPDCVVFGLRKFLQLAAESNPNILELLFTDPADHLYVHPSFRRILERRHLFLSKRVRHSFAGYAHSQLKRIQTHRRWLLHPVAEPPARAAFGLPEYQSLLSADQRGAIESLIQKKLEEWLPAVDDYPPDLRIAIRNEFERLLLDIRSTEETRYAAAARALGVDDNLLDYLQREKGYRGALHEYKQYQNWLATRNPARAELERKYTYDCKHASHLVRLYFFAKQILETGDLTVKRTHLDAELLLHIRSGGWTYERVMEFSQSMDQSLEEATARSPLPWGPDHEALDRLCIEVVEEWI